MSRGFRKTRIGYALRRIEGDTAHFLMVTFWESEDAVRAFAGDDISVAKYYDLDKTLQRIAKHTVSSIHLRHLTRPNELRKYLNPSAD